MLITVSFTSLNVFLSFHFKHVLREVGHIYSIADKGWSMANYHQSSAFDRPYYQLMIIATDGFSKKSFFVNIIFIS